MSRDINPFGLRMPASLKASIEAEARVSGRSLNAEIVHRLAHGVGAPQPENAKRQVVVDALMEAVAEVVRWWDAVDSTPEADEYRDNLKDAMQDLTMWHGRLERMDARK